MACQSEGNSGSQATQTGADDDDLCRISVWQLSSQDSIRYEGTEQS